MCNGLPRPTLSYSGDTLRSFNVQPTSQLLRDVRKRLFSLTIWSPRYKHVNKVNSNGKQSFDHCVTVRKSVPGVKLGVITLFLIISRNINWTLWYPSYSCDVTDFGRTHFGHYTNLTT